MASQPSALVSGTLPLCILFRLLCGCVFFFLFAQYEWTGGFDLSHVPFCVPFSFFTPLFPLPLSLLTRAQTNCQYVCVCVSLTHFFFHYWCDIPPPFSIDRRLCTRASRYGRQRKQRNAHNKEDKRNNRALTACASGRHATVSARTSRAARRKMKAKLVRACV